MDRKKLIFIVSVVLFAVSVSYRLMNLHTQKTVKTLAYQGSNPVTSKTPEQADTSTWKKNEEPLFDLDSFFCLSA